MTHKNIELKFKTTTDKIHCICKIQQNKILVVNTKTKKKMMPNNLRVCFTDGWLVACMLLVNELKDFNTLVR